MFKVGQKVVCVKTVGGYPDSPIVGKIYTVTGTYNNCSCGPCVTIGIMDHAKKSPIDRCNSCGEVYRTVTHEWEIVATYFRPLVPPSVHQELIEQFHLTQVPEAPELIPQTA